MFRHAVVFTICSGCCALIATAASAQSLEASPSAGGYRSLSNGPIPAAVRSTAGPPPNVVVPPMQGALVHRMWVRSPTFRRQCDRIAATEGLIVTVTLDAHSLRRVRGVTTMRWSEARLEARILLLDLDSFVEMLAHEIEHVIEQLDGVDIEARARYTRAEVIRNGVGFETERAIAVGRQVAREVASWTPE